MRRQQALNRQLEAVGGGDFATFGIRRKAATDNALERVKRALQVGRSSQTVASGSGPRYRSAKSGGIPRCRLAHSPSDDTLFGSGFAGLG